MKSLKVDENNNLIIDEGLELTSGNETLRQDVRNILKMWEGEFPFNKYDGIPYYDALQSGDFETLKRVIEKTLAEDSRIAYASVELEVKGDKLTFEITITTKEGEKINV